MSKLINCRKVLGAGRQGRMRGGDGACSSKTFQLPRNPSVSRSTWPWSKGKHTSNRDQEHVGMAKDSH